MQPYIVLLGVACLVNAVCAGVILSREHSRPESRVAALLHGGAAWWGVCEIAWNLAPERTVALAWMRASAPGWVFAGPLVLHAFVALSGGDTRLRRLLPAVYAVAAGFVVLTWTTPAMMADAVRTGWGWGYEVGGAYPIFYAATLAAVTGAYTLLPRLFATGSWDADRRQLPFIVAGMVLPLGVASTTDVLLPIVGVQVLRLGTVSFAVLGILTVANVIRFGHSLVVPGNFSDEILASLSDGVALLHPNGRIRIANDGLGQLTGRSQAELERLEISEILECESSDLRDSQETEGWLRTASGARMPVAITSRAVGDRQENPLGLVVSLRDLREVESLRNRLVTSDRLAAVGQLAAGIAHEINNPLAFVRANLSHLEGHWKKLRGLSEAGEIAAEDFREVFLEADELITESLEGVDRAAEIVRGVRGFSHAGSGAREPTDLGELLDQVLIMASPRLRGRVEVERSYAELPPVYCAAQQMKQVFLNLVVNAAQALGEQGLVLVSTRQEDGGVVVAVADDGPGIPDEIRDRIFDPFFTTKPVGEGQGLGLGIALEIVHGHGGRIDVESEPDRGTTFRVRLPIDARRRGQSLQDC